MGDQPILPLQRLIAATTEDEAHRSAAELLGRLVQSVTLVISLDEGGCLVHEAIYPSDSTVSEGTLPLSDGTIEHAFECGSAEVIDELNGTRSTAAATTSGSPDSFRSALIVPSDNRLVIVALSQSPVAFSSEIVAKAEVITALLSAVLEQLTSGSADPGDVDFAEIVARVLDHDIKGPLNIAHGHISMAMETGQTDRLGKAKTALERIEEITQGVVRFARTGDCPKDPENIELGEVADRAWEIVDGENATLVIDRSMAILADPSLLGQLLENLFRNAVEHGGEGVTVRVGILEEDWGFYVEDDGVGISPDERERVFSSGYSNEEDHLGVGLKIVSDVANTHGWDVELTESETGGARFEFSASHLNPAER